MRSAFFISDSTGVTAETLGDSLLNQFSNLRFRKVILPYVDTPAKAEQAVEKIRTAAAADGARPIIVDTIVNPEIRAIIATAEGFVVDILSTFLAPLEAELEERSSYTVGRTHNAESEQHYKNRIDAMNYALDNDDGARVNRFHEAQLILIGVSRSGKTPSSIYLALHSGVFTANYPLTSEDLDSGRLPKPLESVRERLYGLTIEPARLSVIRSERRANSRYASLTRCEDEVRAAEGLFKRFNIPYIDTTHCSIEEIAARILADTGIRGQLHA